MKVSQEISKLEAYSIRQLTASDRSRFQELLELYGSELSDHRRKGLAGRLIQFIIEEGARAGWSHLRWLVPETDTNAIGLYRKIATEAPWKSFIIRLNPEKSL